MWVSLYVLSQFSSVALTVLKHFLKVISSSANSRCNFFLFDHQYIDIPNNNKSIELAHCEYVKDETLAIGIVVKGYIANTVKGDNLIG